jgi:hypothetical protein
MGPEPLRKDARWGEAIQSPLADITPAPDAGLPTEPDVGPDGRDLALERMVADQELERKRLEEEAGTPVKAVVYTPGTPRPVPWRLVGIAIVLAIIIVATLYLFAIPRADADLVIRYNEGLLGGINVDARLENHGTREMDNVKVTILVQNSTDVRMADLVTFEGNVPSHGQKGMEAISFIGDQWDTYHIFVEWSFTCAGNTYTGSEHYSTEGDAMNQWFTNELA